MAKRRQHGTGGIIKKGKIWYLRYYDNGKRREPSTGTSDEAEARRQLKIRIGEVAAAKKLHREPSKATVADMARLVIEDYKEKNAASTDDAKSRSSLHIVPKLGKILITALSAISIKAYTKERLREGAAAATVNRELSVIRRGLKLATEQDPPWISVPPKVQMLRENNEREGFIDHDQYKRLRELLPPHVQMALVIGYHVGLRRGAVVQLRLDQVDLNAGVIRVEVEQVKKSRDRHSVPLFGDLRPYVEMSLSSNKKYLCELNRKPLGSFAKTWATACKAAGLPGLLFHDLRRSAVRNMIQAGIPESVAMKISGHKTQSMLQRYNIIAERDVVRAGQRINEHLNGPSLKLGEKLGEEKMETNVPN